MNAPTVTAPTGSPAPTTAPYDPTEQVWFSGPFEQEDDQAAESSDLLAPGEPAPDGSEVVDLPDGSTAGVAAGDPVLDADAPGDAIVIDPCRLLPLDEWSAWSGDNGADRLALDADESCIYLTADDLVRATVTALPDAAGLSADMFYGAAISATASGDASVVAGFPTPFASTAFSDATGTRILVTIYSRDPARTVDDLVDQAAAWVALGAGRL
ncbi:hypothetical protein [Naasia lichenicola]|uniref:Uncharacterized protein n=1 Tax=Naasia lichenicola TaxID=2565933 RepID=A0A4S4FRU9_9MICO|nr:hypothetical protein [Naasia lichenicola]THG33393.1 hypothetical protein E6C64_03330 [Naasia lichenicola]